MRRLVLALTLPAALATVAAGRSTDVDSRMDTPAARAFLVP